MKKKLKKIVIGNMKMHGSLAFNEDHFKNLLQKLNTFNNLEITLCVPYPYLFQAQKILAGSNINWGCQNVAKEPEGPYTGEVSASMIKDFQSKLIIVGHSERNTAYCESDENIAEKFNMIKKHNMTPLLCVGENLNEREAGIMEKVVAEQIKTILDMYGSDIFKGSIVAYEPIWAIGSDSAASPNQIEKMCDFIKQLININSTDNDEVNIVYGGSVNAKNAVQLCEINGVDGVLMGRSSLNTNEFYEICNGISKI